MPDEDFHLADHARSQAHDPGFRRDDERAENAISKKIEQSRKPESSAASSSPPGCRLSPA